MMEVIKYLQKAKIRSFIDLKLSSKVHTQSFGYDKKNTEVQCWKDGLFNKQFWAN